MHATNDVDVAVVGLFGRGSQRDLHRLLKIVFFETSLIEVQQEDRVLLRYQVVECVLAGLPMHTLDTAIFSNAIIRRDRLAIAESYRVLLLGLFGRGGRLNRFFSVLFLRIDGRSDVLGMINR